MKDRPSGVAHLHACPQIPLIDAQYKENKELRSQNDDLAGRLSESENTRNKIQANLGAAESNLAKVTADEKSL